MTPKKPASRSPRPILTRTRLRATYTDTPQSTLHGTLTRNLYGVYHIHRGLRDLGTCKSLFFSYSNSFLFFYFIIFFFFIYPSISYNLKFKVSPRSLGPQIGYYSYKNAQHYTYIHYDTFLQYNIVDTIDRISYHRPPSPHHHFLSPYFLQYTTLYIMYYIICALSLLILISFQKMLQFTNKKL